MIADGDFYIGCPFGCVYCNGKLAGDCCLPESTMCQRRIDDEKEKPDENDFPSWWVPDGCV